MSVWHAPTTQYVVVKTHGFGTEWWESHDLPPTRTIGCRSLEDPKYDSRDIKGDKTGKHFIYIVRFFIPTFEVSCYIDTHTTWTRLPPDPSKYWIDERDPAEVTTWPDIRELMELVK